MLLTNWLNTITSRIKKRPTFRSRDRRAIRKRWQSAVHNQISTTEVLEDRTLLTTFFVDDDFSILADTTVIAGTDTDQITAGEQNAVVGTTAFDTIQEALGFVTAGDTIMVAAGIYNEIGTLNINDSISIIGEGKDVVQIRKAGAPVGLYDEVIHITANDVTISGAQLGWEIHTGATDYNGYVVTTTGDNTTLNNLLFSDNYRSAVVFEGADNLEVSDSIFEGKFGRAAIRDGNGGSGENFLITRNEFREDHYRWGPISIGPQGTFGDPNNFAFSGEISFNYFANGLEAGAFQEAGDQNYTVTITNRGMTPDGIDIIHNTFDWQDSSTINQNGNFAQSGGVFFDPTLTVPPGSVNISDNIFTGFTYDGPQPSTDPLWSPAGGVFGGALEFDGVDDFGFFQDALFDVGTAGTLNFWVNMDDQSRRNQFFEGLQDLGFEFQFRENGGGQFFGSPGRDGNGGDNYVIQSGGAGGTEGVWQNLQYTWDFNGGVSPEMHIFIDGVEVGYLSTTYDADLTQWVNAVSTVNQLITVGKDAGGGRFFDGLMDDIGWFNAALDQTDRDNIRDNGVAALAADARLVAHWDFDQAAGTTAIDNKNGIEMQIVANGISPFGPEFRPVAGQFGGALEFDGVDDFATFQDAAFDVGAEGTLSFWVNMDDVGKRNEFFKGPGDGGLEFQYRTNTGGQFFGRTQDNGEFVIQDGGAAGNAGVWTNIQYTWDSATGEMRIYVNGAEVGYLAGFDQNLTGFDITHFTNTISGLMNVGRDPEDASRFFNGMMDDIAWFNEVLSDPERLEIVGTSVGTSSLNNDPRLVAYWNLDDAPGTTVVSGNGGTNIDLLIQAEPALPPVQGFAVIAPLAASVTYNIFTGNDLDSNLTLDPSNQTGTLDLLYAKDSDPLYVPTDSLAEQYRVGFGSPAAYMSSDIDIDPATASPHIGAYQGFPGYYGTGDILIYGTNDNDLLNITFTAEDEATFTFTRDVGGPGEFTEGPVILTGITSFTFFGLQGDDTLRITNPAGGLVNPVNGITFNGGDGGEVLGDTLEILSGLATTVEHRFTNANDGSVFFDGEGTATITYTGLEPVIDTIVATDRIFSFTSGPETITLSNSVTPGETLIDSTLGESISFVNPSGTVTINTELSGGTGADVVNIDGVDPAFTANLTVVAGTDDTINTGTVNIGAGNLDLTAGQVNVNGAFTTTGSVDIDSTLGNITFAAAGSIDAGTSEIDLTAASNVNSLNVTTTSEVRVTATTGGINDLTLNAQITADRVALRAGIGGITGIATTVNTLAASATDGGFDIDNIGSLEIGSVDSLNGITANSSQIFVTATGALTVNQAVSAEIVGYLRAVDAAGAGQDLNVNAGVTSTVGNLNLQAGDNLNLATGVTLNAAAAMILNIDNLSADVGGGIANLNGILQAGTNITVNGGTAADQVIIDSNGGTAIDGGTVNGIQAAFTFMGGGGLDNLILDETGDASGDTISISHTGAGTGVVSGAGLAGLGFNFAGPAAVTLNTGTDADDISVELGNGSPDINITSAGGTDSLTVLGRAAGDDLLLVTPGSAATGSGSLIDLGFNKQITFAGVTGDVLIDGRGSATTDLVTVLGTAGVDTTTIGPSGPVLLAEIDPTLVTIGVQNIDVLAVNTGLSEDVIEVSPDLNIAIDIKGGDPTAPAVPGDTLTYLTPMGEASTFTPSGPDSGTISATGGYQDVTFDEIETVNLGGSITVTGTAADDVLVITATSANSGTYQITSGGVPGPVVNITAITDFTFNGGDGDDILIIDNSGITPTAGTDLFNPVNGIFFNGEGNTIVGDSLQILGGDATTVEHRFTSNNDGSIFIDNAGTASITYTGLEPIQDTITATDRIFSYLGASETIILSDDGDIGDGESQIDSTLGESVAFVHPTSTLTINTEASGGSGVDLVLINAVDSTFTANLTVNAGNDDTITTTTVNIGAGIADLNAGLVNIIGTLTATGGVDIDADTSIIFTPLGIIDAGASNIDLTANNGNITLGQVTTTGDVTLTATAAIPALGLISDVNLAGNNITATNATLVSSGDVGLLDALEIAVTALEANTGGLLNVDNTGALTIGFTGGINGITVGAASTITSTDTMTVAENVAASGGNLLLQNTGGDFVLNTMAMISNNSTFEIGIDSAGAVTLADGSTVTSSGTGLINIDAVNNINLANINTSGEVQITTSAGSITDNTASEAALITADTVALRAATGIGAAGAADIDLAINTLAADTTAGDIFLQEPSAATIGTVDLLSGITAGGNINLVIGGTLNINQKIEATGAASTIVVTGDADINVNQTVQTNGGTIDLLTDNDLILNGVSVIDTTSTAVVTLTADADSVGGGAFTQADGGLVDARGGALNLSSTGNVLIADLRSAGGTITIGSTSGAIVDNTAGEAALISGGQLAISALNGIGTPTGDEDIDTAVGTLSATTTSNDIVISNTGALIIGDVAPLSGVTSTNGAVTITTTSLLTVGSNVTGGSTVTLTAVDSAAAGDDLTINAGITVQSTGANVVLTAGDDFAMDATSSIIALTTIEINVDPSAGDPDAVGGTLDLFGSISAAGGTTLRGGDDNDTFNVLPSTTSSINVIGGDPTLPTFPGDVLNLDFSGLVSAPVLTLGMAAGSGAFSFLPPDLEQAVTYSSIENVTTSTGAYHLVLDMLASGFQDTVADTIDAALNAGGTDLVLDINTVNFFTGAVADILSFTVLGSTDSDTLNINESAGGMLNFTTAAPAGIPGSMGSHLNAAADFFLEDVFNPNTYDANDITIHYDGGMGMGTDRVNVNFITNHDAGYFSDTDDTLGSGNIVSATTAGTDIDMGLSFGNVEGVGIFGTTTGGGLHVDASSTPLTTQVVIDDAAGVGISQIMANGGFSDLLFSGFNDLQVVSGAGGELIDLIALDAASSLTDIELDADDVFGTNAANNDTIRVRSTPVSVTSINILAAAGDDTIQIYDAGNTVDNITNANFVIDGEGGNDTLTIIDFGDVSGDTVVITSTTVDGLFSAAGTDITFANIDNLNVTATSGNDTIDVSMTTQEDLDIVTINGASGNDDFNLNNSTPMGVDTRLNGNLGEDNFIFLPGSILRGFINGGGDGDTIDYSTYAVVHVALSGLGTVDGFQGRENNGSIQGTGFLGLAFDNIDNLIGSAGSDTLQGANLNNYWGITTTDNGLVIADRANLASGRPTTAGDLLLAPGERQINFTSFQNLIGGTQDDRFDLSNGAGLTGTLNGSTGNDSLDYRDYITGVNVDLFAGTATNIGGLALGTGGGDDDNSIENVFGGNGNDFITGDNDNNILGDGFGNDNLDGGGNGVGSGNGGNDVFLMEPGNGGSADVITDIHGNDTIDFRFASAGITFDVDLLNTPQDVFGGNTVELRQILPQQPVTNPSFLENIVGSELNDLIFIDPLSQDGNDPIDGPPVLRSADGRGGFDVLDFDAKGQAVIDTGFSLTADGVGTVQYLNFENVNPFEDSPAFIVDNGDAAFTITGAWPYHPHGTAAITNGIGFENDIHTVPGSTPTGNGPAQAFWEFFGLTPGVYRVSVTWPVSTNPAVVGQVATDAPFTVFDGARTDVGTSAVNLATVALNQQLAPDDFTAAGAVWEDLGIFTINSRTLTVMLTNLADGKVTADAIRIERVSAGPEVELTDTTDLIAPPTIVVDGQPGGIQFGATELLTPAVRTFRIANNGSAQLDLSNVVIPAGYSVLGLPASIGAGSFVDFTITMDASSFGDRSGIFSFDTNDVDEATFNILLDGRVSNVVIIDDGDLGFIASPGFESFPTAINAGLNGYEGDVTGAVPNQPGTSPAPAAATATWTFNGLADGNYRVSTTWSPSYNRVNDAPYSLNGGAAIDVDQRIAPASFTEDGVAWFDLDASFAIVGGQLVVILSNDANSFPRDAYDLANGVIADAIRIEYLPEPDIQVTVDGGIVVDDDTGIVDFGSTLPGIPVSKTFTITNLSTADVDVTGLIEFPPGFSIDPASLFGTTNAPFTISGGGGSVTFIVQFDGGTNGATFGQISFTTDDPDANPYNFTVRGTAGPATVEITDTVDFSTIGTWSEHTPGSVGDPEFLYAGDYHTGGTGANSATWSFDVEPGRYQVVAHWYVHPDITSYGRGAASNAPYTIFDNVTPVTTVLMNQQANPDDFLDDGTFWEYIGDPVEITSSMLNVFLSDNANGIVYADEVRIYRVVDPIIKVEVDGGTVADGGVVDFEETIVGAPVIKTFTVTNYGERNMALGGIIVPAGFTLLAPLGNTNLAPGASTTFTLQMAAGTPGSFSGMVRFGVDSQDANPFNFTVSGTAQDHMIVDNGDLNYSTSGPWETRNATTIFNYFQNDQDLLTGDLAGTNTATWQFTNLAAGTYQVGSTWSAHSSMASNAAITISGIEGGSQTVSLDQRFAPNDFVSDGANWEQLGYFQVTAGGTLTITLTDDGANGYLAADAMLLALVPAISLAPEIDVQIGATALTSGVSGVDFGTAFFGESVFQTVTVTNSGTTTLNLGAINTPAGFTVSTLPGDTSLAAGQSTTFVLEFNSNGAPGAYAGAVTIASDDADENPFTFNVSATMVSSIILDNGEVGFNSSGNFFLAGSPFYYGQDSQRLNNGGTGTATWDFTGLTAGTYQVSTTWNAHATRDSSVDYNVTSSGVGGGVTAVSQRVAPNDFTADGTTWEILGTVTVGANGTITVTLSDTATDGSILADAVRIERTGPLVAAAGTGSGIAPVITQADLNSVRDAALNYWAASGLSETQLSLLQSVNFVLSDLPDAMLGGATSTTIMIDVNAAGYGWFVDDTPFDSSEFTLDANGNLVANEMGAAFGRMDLLTVVMHELGHTLGYDHEDGNGLMGESLNDSQRRLPVLEDAAASDIDDFFSSIAGGENPLLN
tara:strand:+ start:57078 stop:71642 length:14565 start_codon:yes stop_codon:yes gene_type:complete